MTNLQDADTALLAKFIGLRTGEGDSAGAEVFTAETVARLAQGLDIPLSDEDTGLLNILCRKIDIARKVSVSYGPDWKKPVNGDREDPAVLLALALVLALSRPADGESARGQRLKWLNAAYNVTGQAEEDGALPSEDASAVRGTLDRELESFVDK